MKFMNKKRIASSILAGALALSMATPAFASTPSTEISAAYSEIKLSVTVPTTGKAVINPYGLPYTLGESTISGEQITTGAPLTIQNKSAVALKVGAKVTTTAAQGITFDGSAPNAGDYDTDATKKLFVQFEAFPADAVVGELATDTAFLNSQFAALKSEDAVLTAILSTSAPVTAATAAGKADLVLREANADGELQKGGVAFFRLAGQAAKGATWESTDTFTSTVAFTFTPAAYVKKAGTLTTASQGLVLSGAKTTTATLALALPEKITAKKVEWVSSKPTQVKVEDASTGLGTASAVVKANITGLAETANGSAAKITVNVTGSDGITYTATTDSSNNIEVGA